MLGGPVRVGDDDDAMASVDEFLQRRVSGVLMALLAGGNGRW